MSEEHRSRLSKRISRRFVNGLILLVPIVITATTTAISSAAYAGTSIVVIPWVSLIFGFALSWLVLFLVQWWPARSSLRADIAVGLRAA